MFNFISYFVLMCNRKVNTKQDNTVYKNVLITNKGKHITLNFL